MNSILIELHYLPCIAYFSALQNARQIIVEKYEHFEKQTFRNRCYINTAHGKAVLIIPLISGNGKTLTKDMRIDYSQKWLNNHWRTIQSAYGKAPFFEYYFEDLYKIIFQRFTFLYDLNYNLLTMCLKWIGCNISIQETTVYEKESLNGQKDFRSVLNPKKEDSCNRFFKSVEYPQVFGSKFVDNLSIIDLVFCEGPGAMKIVQASALK